jgi:catechol 2,3-dioxygenase-like lactoylglutathione lyase family enzyme
MPAFPTLAASDLAGSRQFYVEGLGFKHIFSIPGLDGQPALEHIRFCRYADLLLEPLPRDAEEQPGLRGQGVRLTFSLPLAGRDAEEIAQRARELGALVEGPVERPWSVRDVVVQDPDGYVLVFTEPVNVAATFDDVLASIASNP